MRIAIRHPRCHPRTTDGSKGSKREEIVSIPSARPQILLSDKSSLKDDRAKRHFSHAKFTQYPSRKKCRRCRRHICENNNYLLSFLVLSHCWLAIPQLVLQADWQEVWHSPQPPFFALAQRFLVSRVVIRFISISSIERIFLIIIPHRPRLVNQQSRKNRYINKFF